MPNLIEDRTRFTEGQALIDATVRATCDEWQKEKSNLMDDLVQTIEGKIRIAGPTQR